MNLLHIDASKLAIAASVSRQASAAIGTARPRGQSGPDHHLRRDLAAEPLDHLSGAHLGADHRLPDCVVGPRPRRRSGSAWPMRSFIAATGYRPRRLVHLHPPPANCRPGSIDMLFDLQGLLHVEDRRVLWRHPAGDRSALTLATSGGPGALGGLGVDDQAGEVAAHRFGFAALATWNSVIGKGIQVSPDHRGARTPRRGRGGGGWREAWAASAAGATGYRGPFPPPAVAQGRRAAETPRCGDRPARGGRHLPRQRRSEPKKKKKKKTLFTAGCPWRRAHRRGPRPRNIHRAPIRSANGVDARRSSSPDTWVRENPSRCRSAFDPGRASTWHLGGSGPRLAEGLLVAVPSAAAPDRPAQQPGPRV